jgi:hypothetical protein
MNGSANQRAKSSYGALLTSKSSFSKREGSERFNGGHNDTAIDDAKEAHQCCRAMQGLIPREEPTHK